MPRPVFLGMILLVVTVFGPSSSATNCYVCAGSAEGASCHVWNTPNFSMTRCELKCLYFTGSVCFCRTYGDTCIEPGPGRNDGEEADVGAEDVATEDVAAGAGAWVLTADFRYTLTPQTLRTLEKEAGPLIAGFFNWAIPASLEGPGPHRIEGMLSEDADTYELSGEITFMYGTAVIRYEIKGHPKLATLEAQFGPRGFGGTVLVGLADGTNQRHDFTGR